MRQLAAGPNRFWLGVVGLLLLIGGLLSTAIATGFWLPVTAAVGLGVRGPQPISRIVGSGVAAFLGQTLAVVVVLALGVVLGILGLVWLLAQIPRTNAAKPFRLHDSATSGMTVCSPGVLSAAVTEELKALPGVTAASAVLRGSAGQPELTVRVTANERTDLRRLLGQIQSDVAGHLATAMEVPVRRLGVQLDISNTRQTSNSVTI